MCVALRSQRVPLHGNVTAAHVGLRGMIDWRRFTRNVRIRGRLQLLNSKPPAELLTWHQRRNTGDSGLKTMRKCPRGMQPRGPRFLF